MRAHFVVLVTALALGCGAGSPRDERTPPSGAGHPCTSDAECAPGTACCYPCGVDGCENACLPVRPGEGCPALP